MIEQIEMAEQFTIGDLDTLKVIADPLRLMILKAMKTGRTVKEVAAEIDTPPTKLYYHVNQLEKHGLIRVVATNVVSGIIEKKYQVVAHRYDIDEDLLSDQDELVGETLETLVIAILDETKNDLRKSIRSGLVDLHDRSHDKGRSSRGSFRLTREQAAEFGSRLDSLSIEYGALSRANEQEPNARTYGFTVVFYPTARNENDPEEELPNGG